MTAFEQYGLKRIINASGTMTSLGASRAGRPVIEAMGEILPEFVDMRQLQAAASGVIAEATGAEAGCVTACAASGLALSCAGCMTGTDVSKIERLPDTESLKSEIILQKGHAVNFGGHVTQMVRLIGATCVEIGTVSGCGAYQLAGAINEKTAAAVYVVSHHTVQSELIGLADFVKTAHAQNIPVLVDAASEYDLQDFLETGADLVVYSGHKFLGGPTSGIVAGKKDLVRACYFQEKGIGRCMKVGKESIVGALEALRQWDRRDAGQIRQQEDQRLQIAFERLTSLKGLSVTYHEDWTGNPITRLKVAVDPEVCSLSAFEISRLLSSGDPVIQVRDHHVDLNFFLLDPCNLLDGEIEIVCDRIESVINHPEKRDYPTQNLADLDILSLSQWPD